MSVKKIKNYIAAAAVILLFAGFFPGEDDIYFKISKNIDLFSRVYKEISFNYVDDIDTEEFMHAGIKGMLNTLDPYTVFIDDTKNDDIELITNGKYGGIGITIGIRGDKITIVEVLDGYSAQRQGIKVGDVLIEAEKQKISPENIDDISLYVKGDPGTPVEIKVTRNDGLDTVKFNLMREEVIVKSLTYYGFYPENSGNVYLKLTSFSRSAGEEVRRALKELKEEREIESVIFDLRGNPGGLLDVAVDISDKFLKKGLLVVTTKGRDEASEKKYYSSQEPLAGEAKLVLLINEGSASASEIVAGAIQDHDRGVIVGTKSFGKGLVQTVSPLNYNSSLKITTARYYTPSGRSIQKVDYAKKNKVITDTDSIIENTFYTDHQRLVYSAGGITPDTTVEQQIEGNITKELLAKGLVFRFADNYFNLNADKKYESFKDKMLFDEFKKFVELQDFKYNSEAEKEIDKLIKDSRDKKLQASVEADLDRIKKQFEKMGEREMDIYEKEIIKEIRIELASRYFGTEGRILENLKNDSQVQTALELLRGKGYSSFLTFK